jgi:hypothetical protein
MSDTQSALVCRLRPKQIRGRYSPTSGEVELENQSGAPLDIRVRYARLQYLNLVVTDESGNLVSTSHYGDLFSPVAEPFVWRLQPGEKFAANVSLLHTVPPEKQLPGAYSVRAVYECPGHRVVSAPLTVTLGASEAPPPPPAVPATRQGGEQVARQD